MLYNYLERGKQNFICHDIFEDTEKTDKPEEDEESENETTQAISSDGEQEKSAQIKEQTLTLSKPKKADSDTNKTADKTVKAKKPDEMSKEKSDNIEEASHKESSEDNNDVKTKIDIKMIKDEEFSSDDKAPYAKVREAKVMTLCDTVGLCYFNLMLFDVFSILLYKIRLK